MSRFSRLKLNKNTNETKLSEKKETFPVHGNKRKVIVNADPKKEDVKEPEKKTVEPDVKKEEVKNKEPASFKKKGRMKFSKKDFKSTPEEDNTSFYDTESLYDESSAERDNNDEEHEPHKQEVVSDNNSSVVKEDKPEPVPSESSAPKTPSFKAKKKGRFHDKGKTVVKSNGQFKKAVIEDGKENISEENENVTVKYEDYNALRRRPTAPIKNGEEPDVIIRPYSSFDPENGVYRKDTHQETSNIRFTESDRVLAEKSGLSWD